MVSSDMKNHLGAFFFFVALPKISEKAMTGISAARVTTQRLASSISFLDALQVVHLRWARLRCVSHSLSLWKFSDDSSHFSSSETSGETDDESEMGTNSKWFSCHFACFHTPFFFSSLCEVVGLAVGWVIKRTFFLYLLITAQNNKRGKGHDAMSEGKQTISISCAKIGCVERWRKKWIGQSSVHFASFLHVLLIISKPPLSKKKMNRSVIFNFATFFGIQWYTILFCHKDVGVNVLWCIECRP